MSTTRINRKTLPSRQVHGGFLAGFRLPQLAVLVGMALLLCLCLLIKSTPVQAGKAQPTLRQIQVEINGQQLTTEVAATNEERRYGLSHRTEMPQNHAMLFVYEQPRWLLFTMQDTLIPLSIAFIAPDGTINEILQMDTGTGPVHASAKPGQFALEVNQGWFKRYDIEAGDKISFLEPLLP